MDQGVSIELATLETVCNLGDSVQPQGQFATLVTVCNLGDSLQPWRQFATLGTCQAKNL